MSDTLTEICIALHDAYERAAEEEGWKTNTHCRTAWGSLPEANRRTMLRAVGETVMPRIAELSQQLAEAQKDAARYRWLKNGGIYDLPYNDHGFGPDFGHLDEAIDGAMQGEKK